MFIQRANNNFDIQLADIPTPSFANTYSLDFDGVDDYVSCGDSNDFSFGNGTTDSPFSISAWVKMDTVSNFIIASKDSTSNREYVFRMVSNTLRVFLLDNSSGGYIGRWYNSSLTSLQGVWSHLCFSYNGNSASSGIKIYLNGLQVDDSNYQGGSYTAMENTTADFNIGKQDIVSLFSDGNIDEVSLYNRVLTQEEITSISAAPTDLTDLNPIAWYRMGDNGAYKSPQWLIPNNENKDKVSNYSFEFDGTDDRVQLSSDFVASGEFTLSFWMKPVAVTGNGNIFPIGTFPDNQNHVRLDQIGVMYLKVQAVLCLFNEGVVGGGANNLVLNEWQHISFIRDSSNIITCYRNGAIFGATVTNSGTLTLNSIGRVIANTFGFQGGLDEIAYWNSDETANLSTIYNGGEPTTLPSGAVAHYKLGEEATFSGGVWTVPDAVGSNNGTSNAMTIDDRVGEAPNSTNNAVSFNMDLVDRVTDTP